MLLMFLNIMMNTAFAYTLTINDFTTDVGEGRKVTSIASPQYTFLNWTGTGIELTYAVQKKPKLEFRMPANDVTITAHYKETESTPIVKVTKGNITTNSITVSVQATDSKVGMPNPILYNYYYKLASSNTYILVPGKQNISENVCLITDLLPGNVYDIKVTTKNNYGNIGTGYLTNVQVSNISGQINISEPTWTNGKANVTLSTNTNFKIQYQLDSKNGKWLPENGKDMNLAVNNISNNQTIYARLIDGENAGESISFKITDNILPNSATVSELPSNMVEGNNFNVTVTHTDNESGIDLTKCKWVFNQNLAQQISEGDYINSFGSSNMISIITPKSGTYYLHILSVDKANNKTQTVFGFVACEGGTEKICSNCGGDGRISSSSTCLSCNGTGGSMKPQGHYCSNCNGTGKVERQWITCGTCGGSCKVTCGTCGGSCIDSSSGANRHCGTCGATGKVTCGTCGGAGGWYNGNGWCQTCAGSGWIEDPDKWVSCSSCGGKGTVTSSYSCSSCDGTGTITTKCSHGKTSKHYFWNK